MNTKTILLVIAVLLAGILGVLVYQASQPKTSGEQLEEALEEAADEMGDVVEDLGDEIQNAVGNQNQQN